LNFGQIVPQAKNHTSDRNYQAAKGDMSHPKLARLIREYIELCWGKDFYGCFGSYHAIFVAKCENGTSLTDWHIDKSNVGRAVIHGLGNYGGGLFVVREPVQSPATATATATMSGSGGGGGSSKDFAPAPSPAGE